MAAALEVGFGTRLGCFSGASGVASIIENGSGSIASVASPVAKSRAVRVSGSPLCEQGMTCCMLRLSKCSNKFIYDYDKEF